MSSQATSPESISSQTMQPQISQLFIYPIKSCAGISVSSFQFDSRGPLFDRRWMLVNAKTGIYLSQRELPEMALISTHIDNDRVWASLGGDTKLLGVSDIQPLELPTGGNVVDVSIWSDNVQGLDCGDEAAKWFSSILECECRLIYQGECQRLADTEYADSGTSVSYADGFPLLVVSQASIQFLNDACEADIIAENFRPNVVVANTEVFAELGWCGLSTSMVAMKVVKACQRCVIPTLNTKTAERESSILPVLLKYCRSNKKIYFGQNLTFKVRDESLGVQVLEMRIGEAISITRTE